MNVVSALGSLASGGLLGGGVANFALQAGKYVSGELVVARFEGTERLNQPFTFEVTVESKVAPSDAALGIHGLPARLSIQSADQAPRRVEGIVSGFAPIGAETRSGEKFFHYRLRIVPRLWLLSQRRSHRVFQEKSALDIALAVLGDAWIRPLVRVADPALYRPIPFAYQRGETDLAFVNRILAVAGITYFFIHSQGAASDFPSRFSAPAAASSSGGGNAPIQIAESMVLTDSREGMSDVGVAEALSPIGGSADSAGAAKGAGSSAASAGISAGQWVQAIGGVAGAIGGALGALPAKGERFGAGNVAALSSLSGLTSVNALTDAGATGGTGGWAALGALGVAGGAASLMRGGSAGSLSSLSSLGLFSGLFSGPSGPATASPTSPGAAGPAGPAGAASGAPPAATAGSTIPFAADGKTGHSTEAVAVFEADFELAPTFIGVRDWNSPGHRSLDQSFALDTSADTGAERADTGLGTVEYQRDGSVQAMLAAGDPTTGAMRALAQVRSHAFRATGKSDCRRFAPGYRFSMSAHPVEHLNEEFVLTAVRSRGTNPEKLLDAKTPVYENDFECIPWTVHPCPPKPEPQPALGPEAATVIGSGQNLPLCDSHGRIRVRFHWAGIGDTLAAGASGECLVQWLERWAGPGYGTMTVPRVGSEVWVEFPRHEGGHPVATGQLYSSTNPPPFSFETEPHKVGIRSSSLPRNGVQTGGFNELSMLDAPDGEVLHLRAQRDMTVEVLNDQRTRVERNRTVDVHGSDQQRVGVHRAVTVRGNHSAEVHGDDDLRVRGRRSVSVDDESDSVVRANETRTTLGALTERVGGAVTRSYDGMRTTRFESDVVSHHVGHAVTIVGGGSAPRSAALHVEGGVHAFAKQKVEVTVGEGFTLVCGDSRITVTKSAITIDSPNIALNGKAIALTASDSAALTTKAATVTGKSVTVAASDALSLSGKDAALNGASSVTVGSPKTTLAGQAANLVLDSNFTAQGAQLSLAMGGSGGASQQQQQQKKDAKPATVTTLNLVSEKGVPCPSRPAILRKGGDGGPEIALAMDSAGAATIEGEDSFEVCFPEDPLAGLEGQSAPPLSSGELVPHVVRQGDYVDSLAHRFGFDADVVWSHTKNADLKSLRKDPNVLLPGDILFIAKPTKRHWMAATLGSTNNFVAPVKLVHVKVQLAEDGEPYAGEPYVVDGVILKPGKLDGGGFFEADVPVTVTTFTVRLPAQGDLRFHIDVGHLDPIGHERGLLQRLSTLSIFGHGHVPHETPSVDLQLGLALFQTRYELPVTGTADDATMEKLLEVTGR